MVSTLNEVDMGMDTDMGMDMGTDMVMGTDMGTDMVQIQDTMMNLNKLHNHYLKEYLIKSYEDDFL